MLSKAIGADYGVSKKAAPVIVRLPQAIPTAAEQQAASQGIHPPAFRFTTFLHALTLIIDDIKAGNYQRRAVILLASNFRQYNPGEDPDLPNIPPQPGDVYAGYYSLLTQLSRLGAVIVVTSGNEGINTNLQNVSDNQKLVAIY
jgi:hypothetical protein